MNRSDECCRFGTECLKLARTAEDETNRAVYLHMARVWLALAQEEETSSDKKEAARVAVESVAGVKAVESNVTVLPVVAGS